MLIAVFGLSVSAIQFLVSSIVNDTLLIFNGLCKCVTGHVQLYALCNKFARLIILT